MFDEIPGFWYGLIEYTYVNSSGTILRERYEQ